jgi:hypothetical protein
MDLGITNHLSRNLTFTIGQTSEVATVASQKEYAEPTKPCMKEFVETSFQQFRTSIRFRFDVALADGWNSLTYATKSVIHDCQERYPQAPSLQQLLGPIPPEKLYVRRNLYARDGTEVLKQIARATYANGKTNKLQAYIIQICGKRQEQSCTRCAHGWGLFRECVRLVTESACGSCRMGGMAQRDSCSTGDTTAMPESISTSTPGAGQNLLDANGLGSEFSERLSNLSSEFAEPAHAIEHQNSQGI